MFNKETEYAFRALVYIQSRNYAGHRPGIEETVKAIDAPHFYTAKILQRMVRLGFLQSVKGKGGGFYFDADRPDLPLKDIVMAIEGDRSFCGCVFGLKHCDEQNPCPLHHQFVEIREGIDRMISTQTIQTLAQKYVKDENMDNLLPRLG